ncbi:MAG: divalent-cation tolerance protein CutA [Myxococcota bacterium]
MSTDLRVVLCTAPRDKAEGLARALVEERLVACVNLVPIRSVYRWQGKVVDDEETLLIMKTGSARVADLMARVPQLHPYTVPEVVSLTAEAVLPSYLAWALTESTPAG